MIRDRKYLDWLRTQRCIITGQIGTEYLAVDPAHVGTAGKGIKSSDDEVFPVRHDIHAEMHAHGEMTYYRNNLSDAVLREALRAYAREQYQEYLTSVSERDR